MIDGQHLARRLRSARQAAGLTQEAVAEAMGLSRPAITLIESGDRDVSAGEVSRLAQLYGISIAALMSDGSDEKVLMRLRSATVAEPEVSGELELQIARFREYASLEADVYGQQQFEIPSYPLQSNHIVSQGEWLATQERRRLDLGHRPIGSMVVLVESQGVKLLMPDLSQDPSLSGAFLFTPSIGPCMIVDSKEHPARQRFTLAHEYGHFLNTDRDFNGEVCKTSLRKNPEEVRANAFAAAFLLPPSGVAAFLADFKMPGSPVGPEHLVHIAHHFGVSYEAVGYRLVSMGEMTVDDLEAVKKLALESIATALGYRGRPGDGEPAPSRFREIAIQAWRKDAISASKLEELLQLPRGDAQRTLSTTSQQGRRLKRAPAADPDWL